MDIDSTLRLWSVTAANNKPTGGTVIGSGLDDNIRGLQATVRQFLASQGTSVVASATTDLSTVDGFLIPISGNTTITGFGTEAAGIGYLLNFSGTPTIKNSSTVAVPGAADWSIAAGDMVVAQSLGSGSWKLWGASKANGLPVRAIQPTRQVFTTGASVTYSTPANCSRINVRMVGGGGGGEGSASAGGDGTATTWGTLSAGGGIKGTGGSGGAGGTSSNGDINLPGAAGGSSSASVANASGVNGGGTVFGGSGAGGKGNSGGASAGGAGVANTGGGGGSGGGGGGVAPNNGGGGGGGYCEKLIISPSATYLYTVGSGGSAGSGGASIAAGGAGGTGLIIVDEYYD